MENKNDAELAAISSEQEFLREALQQDTEASSKAQRVLERRKSDLRDSAQQAEEPERWTRAVGREQSSGSLDKHVIQAIEACRQTQEDAMRLFRRIREGGDTYFDRPDVGADVDVTHEHASFLQTVIHRMDIAIRALEAVPAAGQTIRLT